MDTVGHEQLDSDKGGGGACLQVLPPWLERYWNRELLMREWLHASTVAGGSMEALLTVHRWFLCPVLEGLVLVSPRTGGGLGREQ